MTNTIPKINIIKFVTQKLPSFKGETTRNDVKDMRQKGLNFTSFCSYGPKMLLNKITFSLH